MIGHLGFNMNFAPVLDINSNPLNKVIDDRALGSEPDIEDVAIQSFNAGCDILLVCHGYKKELLVIQALKEAAETGKIPQERIDESVYRIIQLKNKYGLTDAKIDDVDITNINEEIDRARFQ